MTHSNKAIRLTFNGVWTLALAGLLAASLASTAQAAPPKVLAVYASDSVNSDDVTMPFSVLYQAGDTIQIEVQFDQNVFVTGSPAPYLNLRLFPQNRPATFFNVSGSRIFFHYVVRPGDYIGRLNYVNRSSLVVPFGATIQNGGGEAYDQFYDSFSNTGGLPALTDPLSLGRMSDVEIRTLSLSGPATVNDGATVNLSISRGGILNESLAIEVKYPPQLSGPGSQTSVLIPSGSSSITFPVTGYLPTTTGVIVRARGPNYPADGSGDATHALQVIGIAPYLEILGGETQLSEAPPAQGGQYPVSTTWTVYRRGSGSTSGSLTVNLSVVDTSPGTQVITLSNTSITIPNGQDSASFSIQARDGSFSATVTASATGYNPVSRTVQVENVAPRILGANVTPLTPTIGEPVYATFNATDVQADIPGLRGTWYWGDGSPNTANVISGTTVQHIYATPGIYTVALSVTDKDGGFTQHTVEWIITVSEGYNLAVTIPGIGASGLNNIGTGYLTFNPLPAVVNQLTPNFVSLQFRENQTSVSMTARPHQPDGNGFNSYVYRIVGDGMSEAAQEPLAGGAGAATVTVSISMGQDRTATVWFSREWRKGDNRGDIDGDGLTDQWELQWGLDPLLAAGVNGGGGSPSGDRMPNAPNVILNPLDLDPSGQPAGGPFGYPIPWSVNWTGYAPLGPLFVNRLQFRGQTLNIWDADYPGTDPTVADTSGDGLTDGWLYYFWANAVNNPDFVGRAYDPNSVTGSLVIANADIKYYFNPTFNRGLAGMDLDGDGLTVLEEYYLGTNPLDWDTDGDGMPDGWEVLYGLNPLDPRDRDENPDMDFMADDGQGNIHHDVYQAHGFDPRTGWAPGIFQPNLSFTGTAPNTRPYNNIDEFLVMRWHMDRGAVASLPASAWLTWSTDPLSPDTDRDGMADGWELYVGLNPSDPIGNTDADDDPDDDGLTNVEEFSARGVAAYYSPARMTTILANAAARRESGIRVFLHQPAGWRETHLRDPVTLSLDHFVERDPGWLNKFWPTDPNNPDTDGDQILDGDEASLFRYNIDGITGTPVYIGSTIICYAGGGLNPTSVDTDGDSLPDYWEASYAGSGPGGGPAQNAAGNWVRNGMDGTWSDAFDDYDNDGLLNYQEYLVGAVYHFNYDKWIPGQGYGGYDAFDFFDPNVYGRHSHHWDLRQIYFQLGEFRTGGPFATTDPRLWDTDGDGMCDYYELFHALNPIWGLSVDKVGKPWALPFDYFDLDAWAAHRDFRLYPWMVGDELADPDQDGLPNWEEALQPNRPAPQPYHTDPTPYWFTDMSYSNSFVNLYYSLGSLPFYWGIMSQPPSYMFSFANNEGYDTDNDNIPDKRESIGSDTHGSTDPLNFNDPFRRNALHLDGNAASRTRAGFFHGANALRSWTVELWLRPEQLATGLRQIIIERPVEYDPGDTMPVTELVRRNFRLGLDEDGRLFVEYDNSGSDLLTRRAAADHGLLAPNVWYHVAGVYDGAAAQLKLYVDGLLVGMTPTAVIPATGVIYGNPNKYLTAPIVVGAADANPQGWVHGSQRYYNGFILDPVSQPDLHSFYQGWVDEIRIWDGARSQAQINADQNLRLNMSDIKTLQAQRRLDPTFPNLLYAYNFSSLPDPDYEGIVPENFDVLNGRPNDGSYPGIPWWMEAADRSTVYDNYLFVHWIQNMVAHLPLDPPLDSVYWSEFSTGGIAATNRFPNSANPYGLGYQHAESYLTERNPELGEAQWSFAFDPATHRLYNDLLPLRNARADQTVDLWDGFGPGSSLNFDSSGDGLPDWWKQQVGLNVHSSDGQDGPWGDPDRDGLPNWAEYMAWLEFGILLDPWSYDTFNDGLADYDSRPHPASPTFGQMYDDWDGIPGLWEIQYGLDPHRYVAHLDADGDGWSNFAEFMGRTQPNDPNIFPKPALIIDVVYDGDQRVGQLRVEAFSNARMDGMPDAVFGQDIQASMEVVDEYMTTLRRDQLHYSGKLSMAPLVPGSLTIMIDRTASSFVAEVFTGVQDEFDAWTSLLEAPYGSTGTINYSTGEWTISLNPDVAQASWDFLEHKPMRADYTSNLQGSPFPFRFSRDLPLTGHLREGRNWFLVYFDVDGTGSWSPGDPADVVFADLSWSSMEMDVVLRDRAFGFPRFAWAPVASAYRDVVIQHGLGGPVIFNKRVRGPRHYLHEGDLIYLDPSSPYYNQRHGLTVDVSPQFYEWSVTHADGQVETGNFSIAWNDPNDPPREPPAMVSPFGSTVRDALVEFRWTMDERNAAVRFEMRQGSTGGPVVIDRVFAAPRRRQGLGDSYYFRLFPQNAGIGFIELADGNYYWRVKAENPGVLFDATPANWAHVALDRTSQPAGPYTISGNLAYFGPVDIPVKVQAFRLGFSGRPVAQVTVSGPNQPFALRGLSGGRYYLRAFMDQTLSGVPEPWETRGFLFDHGVIAPWANSVLREVVVGPNRSGLQIILRDQDTDNDKLPDAWEYAQAGNLTTLGVDNSATPLWQSDPLWTESPVLLSEDPLMADSNQDGLPDYINMLMGTSVFAIDSDQDGFSDLVEFFSGSDALSGEGRPFAIPSLHIDDAGRPVIGWDVPETAAVWAYIAGKALVYQIQWRESLTDGVWQSVGRREVTSHTLHGRHEWTHLDNPAVKGYYRINAWLADKLRAVE